MQKPRIFPQSARLRARAAGCTGRCRGGGWGGAGVVLWGGAGVVFLGGAWGGMGRRLGWDGAALEGCSWVVLGWCLGWVLLCGKIDITHFSSIFTHRYRKFVVPLQHLSIVEGIIYKLFKYEET